MYIGDHDPPHFHAEYGEDEAMMNILTGTIQRGDIPTRAKRLIVEWVALHRGELEENWMRAHSGQPLLRIAPL